MTEWIAEADVDERWVLAQGVVGWVDAAELAEARELAAVVAELEQRRSVLDEEIEAALADARRRGFDAGAADVDAAVRALAGARSRIIEVAAAAAVSAAEVLVGDVLGENPTAVRALVERAMGEQSGRVPERILVSADLVAAVGHLVPDVPVSVGRDLAPGDVVVEYADGKREERIADLLARLTPNIAAHIEANADE